MIIFLYKDAKVANQTSYKTFANAAVTQRIAAYGNTSGKLIARFVYGKSTFCIRKEHALIRILK